MALGTIFDTTKIALEAGADASLVVIPYYNKPTQEGLYQHFKAVAEQVPIPMIIYNNPGRTACDMLPSTLERLSHIANIVGLKESNMAVSRIEELVHLVGEKLDLFTGNDEDGLVALLFGFKGYFSVINRFLS